MGGLTYLHKPSLSSVKASAVDMWRQGVKILSHCTHLPHLQKRYYELAYKLQGTTTTKLLIHRPSRWARPSSIGSGVLMSSAT